MRSSVIIATVLTVGLLAPAHAEVCVASNTASVMAITAAAPPRAQSSTLMRAIPTPSRGPRAPISAGAFASRICAMALRSRRSRPTSGRSWPADASTSAAPAPIHFRLVGSASCASSGWIELASCPQSAKTTTSISTRASPRAAVKIRTAARARKICPALRNLSTLQPEGRPFRWAHRPAVRILPKWRIVGHP